MGNLCGKRVSKPIPFEEQAIDHRREKEPLLHSPPLPSQGPADPSPPSSPPSQDTYQHTHSQDTEVTSHRPADDIPPSKPPSIIQHVDAQPIPILPPPPSAHPSSSLIHHSQEEHIPQLGHQDQAQPPPIVVHMHTQVPVVIPPPRPPSPTPIIPPSPLSSSEQEPVIEVVQEVQQDEKEEEELVVVTAKVQEREQETITVEAPLQSAKRLETEVYTTARVEQTTQVKEEKREDAAKFPDEAAQQTTTEEVQVIAGDVVEPTVQVIRDEDVVQSTVQVIEGDVVEPTVQVIEEDVIEPTVQVIEGDVVEPTVQVIREEQIQPIEEVIAEDKVEVTKEEEVTEDKVEVTKEVIAEDKDEGKEEVIKEDKVEETEEEVAEDKVEGTEDVVAEEQVEVAEEEERQVDEGEEPVVDVREEISFDITADLPEETEMEYFKRLFQNDPETGFLEKERLEYILEILGIMESNVLEFLWDQFDVDGSGDVDFKEFCQMMYQLRAIRKNFEAADVNGDKSISPEELVPVLNKLGITMEAENIFDILKLFDANQDEEIDFSEFLPLSIFLTTLEHEYKEYIASRIARTKWLRPLLGGDIAKEEQVAEQMEALLNEQTVPSMGAVVSIIVLAVNNVVYL